MRARLPPSSRPEARPSCNQVSGGRVREWIARDVRGVRRERRARQRFAREGRELGARGGAVKGDEIRARANREMERRDVREADERLGRAAQRVVVDGVEDAHRAVAAAEAPDAVDARIADGGVEVREPRGVVAGEIAVARECIADTHAAPIPCRAHYARRARDPPGSRAGRRARGVRRARPARVPGGTV